MQQPIHEMPGHLIRRLHQISTSVFAEGVAAAGHDLTSVQFAALASVAERPGIDQATLAGMIAFDRATIGGVVERLQGKGLLTRTVSAADRRARALALTPRGAEVLAALRPVVAALQAEILAGLDAGERDMLVALLRKTAEAGNARSRAPLVLPPEAAQAGSPLPSPREGD